MDEWSTNIEYTIRRRNAGYSVLAIDTSDDEKADIFEEKWDKRGGTFSFAGYWNSTGRFMRCRMRLTATDKIEFTYTYTDSETMVRKGSKEAVVSRRASALDRLRRPTGG